MKTGSVRADKTHKMPERIPDDGRSIVAVLGWGFFLYALSYNAYMAWLNGSHLGLWFAFFPPVTPTRLWWYAMGSGVWLA